jgi:hypothetical protein
MSRRHASGFPRDVRLDFHLGHGIKLSVHRSGISVKVKRKNILKKYVDAVVDHYGVDEWITDILTFKIEGQLPSDAPLSDLAKILSTVTASIAGLALVKADGDKRFAERTAEQLRRELNRAMEEKVEVSPLKAK